MWTDEELTTTLERVNPVPDTDSLPDRGDHLWTSLESKRADRGGRPMRPVYRRRAVFAMAALAVLAAVPAVASWLDGAPPLDREFDPPEAQMLTVYSSERGIPNGCAWRLAFRASGTPLVGGPCGIFELADDRWDLIADEEAVGLSLMDMAVDGDGGIWVASADQPLRRLTGDRVIEMEIASPWIAIAPDGTIWAVEFPYSGNPPVGPATLVAYSAGSWRHIGGASVDGGLSEGIGDVAVGVEGTVWMLAGDELARLSGDRLEAVEFGGPDVGFPMFFDIGPDGAVWVVVHSAEVVDRLGVSDVRTYIVRYDGSSSPSVEIPFAEINDLAVHPDGTVWASSVHGVFSYDGEGWMRYGMAEGMPVNEVNSLDIAPDGSVYATTDYGVVRIRTDG